MAKRNADETFKIVLELQEQGLSRHDIKDRLGYKRLDSVTRIMTERGYTIDKSLDKYIINKDDKGMTGVTNNNYKGIELLDDKGMTISIQQDLKNNIINLANDYDKIQEVLKWFENKANDKGMTGVIEVINEGIKINLPEAETIRTTIRINESTWNRFKKFAEEHKEFNQQDLMAQALEEYMNKYN